MLSAYTRVAVVQIAYHPAVAEMLDDPLFDPKASRHSFVLDGAGVPKKIESAYKNLRARVRKAYVKQLGRRLDVILQHCQDWKVRLVVFPEYSIPAELLERLAQKAPEIVIVAGTHFVDAEGRRSQVYERLLSTSIPAVRNAVCPVLHQGKALSMGAKVHPVDEEQRLQFVSGKTWNGVATPEGIEGPMGVLICRDFLSRDTEQHRTIIAENLAPCRFLAVPSLTPPHTVNEFAANCWAQARREHRPVLYANDASGGGTSMYVDEGRQQDLQDYPKRAGLLDRNEEGMIVADVDLGYDRKGESTPYDKDLPVKPFAAATFVYRGLEGDYAKWLDKLSPLLGEKEGDEFEQLEAIREFVKANEPPMGKATATRERRLRRLLHDVENLPGVEFVRALTREVVFPEDVLPLDVVRAAMARGAAREVERWVGHDGKFGPVKDRLHEPWDKLELATTGWAEKTRITVADVVKEVAGEFVPHDPKGQMPIVDVYEDDIDERFEAENKEATRAYHEGRFADARERYLKTLRHVEGLLEKTDPKDVEQRPKAKKWVANFRLKVALSTLNLQQIQDAREQLNGIPLDDLPPAGRMHLAEGLALVGEIDRARAILPEKHTIPDEEHKKHDVVVQSLELLDGRLPTAELVDSDMIRLRAAPLLLDKGDRAQVAEFCLGIMERNPSDALMTSLAAQFLTEALRRTIIEMPDENGAIPAGPIRAKIITTLEKHFADFRRNDLPELARQSHLHVETAFRSMMRDADWMTEHGAMLDEENVSLGNADDPRNVAFRLAEEGRHEEALRLLPKDHPWGSRLDRIGLLLMGTKHNEALDEVLVLAKDFPDRATIEGQAAELLHYSGRIEEALKYAWRAFKQLPSIQYRLELVDLLQLNGEAHAAWELLKDFEKDKRPRVLLARGIVAEKLGLFAEAEPAWRLYVEKRPKDGRARVHFARLLFVQHKVEDAAKVGWTAFGELGDRLELDALYSCGRLQRLAGELDAEQTRRIKEIAAKIRERFPGDAQAEHIRLGLLTMLGELPGGDERIDFPMLVEAGYVYQGKGLPALIDYFKNRRIAVDTVDRFRRRGAIPVVTSCAIGGARLALVVTRILERSVHTAGFLCPPVSLVDAPPLMHLEGVTILVSDLELLLLEILGLVPMLRKALGTSGRLALFEHASDRILGDAEQLRIDARPDELQKIEALIRKVERLPAVEKDPMAPLDDAAAARRANGVLVDYRDESTDNGTVLISPRSFLQYLRECGILDNEQHSRIAPYLAVEPGPTLRLTEPLPTLIVISWFIVEQLEAANALDATFAACREVLRIGPMVLPHFRSERDERHNEIRAHELADRVHRHLAAEWIDVISEPSATDLPPLKKLSGVGQKLIAAPLREMLAYRDKVLENPQWWRLTAEFFGSTNLGQAATMQEFAWTSRDGYERVVRRLREAAARDLTLPMLVRTLVHDTKAADILLLRLAELGFPDALGAGEILRLERRYNTLDTGEPKRILDHQEWMAREPEHLGGDYARLRLAQTYAAAIFAPFFTTDRTDTERASLLDTLLRRQEEIGKTAVSNALDQTFAHLAGRTAHFWQAAWKEEGDELIHTSDGPTGALWNALLAWSQADGARLAAHGRAMREIWRVVHLELGGPSMGVIGALGLGQTPLPDDGREFSLMDPGYEALAILSSLWTENPFINKIHDELIRNGVALLADDGIGLRGAREAQYRVMFDDEPKPAQVRLPVEALFLRLPQEKRADIAKRLKRVQGIYDGIAYRLLADIEKASGDHDALGKYAAHAASALFRLVQDDPSFIRIWPQAHGFSSSRQGNFKELLDVLSEPSEPFTDPQKFSELLNQRFTKGSWVEVEREDQWKLLLMASEIPGTLPAVTIPLRFANKVYADHVRESLDRLDRSDEHPIARIAGDVMFLRVAAARRPHVKLVEGDIDLRDILPGRFLRLLEKVSAPPAPDTLGAAEPALLRVCGEVIARLTVGNPLSIKYALWLIYRLFQWLCLQLEAISPDARIQGLRQLVQQAPGPRDSQDLLDPVGLSRERFDHRLATVLHAFGVMEDLTNVVPQQPSDNDREKQENKISVADLSFSSSEFEDKLIELAQRAHIGPSPSSVLDWHGPGNVPDLALQALLRLSPKRFADMTPESRLRRFEKLPDDPQECETEDRNQLNLMHLVLIAAANVAANLTPEERSFLEAKVRGMVDGAITRQWQWLLFVNFFESGADHLQEDAWRLMQEHWQHEMAPFAFGWFVLAISRRDLLRVEPTIEATIAGATEHGADAVALVAGALGRLRVHGTPRGQKLARSLLLQLAERPLFREDPRMVELIGFFGLRKAES